MSDRVVQTHDDSDGTPGPSMHPYQSAWMAHWMGASCSATQAHNQLSPPYESKEEGHDTRHHHILSGPKMDISKFSKGFGEVNKGKTVNIMDESPTTSLKILRKEKLDCQPFPMFSFSRNRDSILALKKDQSTLCHQGVLRSQHGPNFGYNAISPVKSGAHLPSMLAWDPAGTKTPSSECHFQPEGVLMYPEKQHKSHNFLGKNSLAVSLSFQDDFMCSSSKIVPCGYNSERTPMHSFMCRPEEINQLSSVVASKESFTNTKNYCGYSTLLVHEKNINNLLHCKKSGDSGRFGNLLSRQNDAALLPQYPSASNNQPPDFVGNQCQKMKNHTGIGLFPSCSCLPEMTKSEELCHGPGCYSLPRLPCYVHDVGTMRVCATVNSVEELSRGPPKFPLTTQNFLITEKTDVNLSDRCQMIRESTVSSKFKGKMLSELPMMSPDFGSHIQGVKLQPLESSTESKGKEKIGEVKSSTIGLKNESSAETDSMDMDAFKENHLSCVASFPLNKGSMAEVSPTFQGTTASDGEKIGSRPLNTGLPDIIQEHPALPGVASSIDDRETSTSRTQSLDVEHLLFHAEQATNSKSTACPDGDLGTEPSSRWVKRLKSSASDSIGHGTKSSKMGEASSHEKVGKFVSKILKRGMTTSEPSMGKCRGKGQMGLDQSAVLLRNGDSSSIDSVVKSRDVILSHSWIRRWCPNQAMSSKKKPKAVVVCEPQSSKATLNELDEKQFPSIAAMALMGKALRTFHPCELRKRGSFVVWNT